MDAGTGCAPKERILLVERDLDVRDALAGILEMAGYEVVGCDHADGVRLLRESVPSPDLILLDLTGAGADASLFRAAQRGSPAHVSIPVVLVSTSPQLAAHAAALEIPRFLHKPFHMDALLDTVAQTCGRPG